jgi:CubicO group peptidase (beta-lactamase class C family)
LTPPGTALYHQRSRSQSLFPSSPPIDENSAFFLGSAGKSITHIAALQLVERGLLSLDEPISKYLVELRSLSVLSKK